MKIKIMSLVDLRNDLAYDIRKYALKQKGKWWANHFFANIEVLELEKELWKEAKTLDGALKLSNRIN